MPFINKIAYMPSNKKNNYIWHDKVFCFCPNYEQTNLTYILTEIEEFKEIFFLFIKTE